MDIELPKIEPSRELNETEVKGTVREVAVKPRRCIFYKTLECTIPDCHYEICNRCPYGYMYSFSETIRDVFRKIISLAIFFTNKDITRLDK